MGVVALVKDMELIYENVLSKINNNVLSPDSMDIWFEIIALPFLVIGMGDWVGLRVWVFVRINCMISLHFSLFH